MRFCWTTSWKEAIEAEADAICDGENVYIIGIMPAH